MGWNVCRSVSEGVERGGGQRNRQWKSMVRNPAENSPVEQSAWKIAAAALWWRAARKAEDRTEPEAGGDRNWIAMETSGERENRARAVGEGGRSGIFGGLGASGWFTSQADRWPTSSTRRRRRPRKWRERPAETGERERRRAGR